MNVNIVPIRKVTYNQLCGVCGQGFLIREDFTVHIRDPNRKIGGNSRIGSRNKKSEPKKPSPLDSPNSLTNVWCGNDKCGIRFHWLVIQEHSMVTEDSAHMEYRRKLTAYEAWLERRTGFTKLR